MSAQSKTEECPYCGQPITRDQLVAIQVRVKKEVADETRAELVRAKAELGAQFEGRVGREIAKRDKERQREFARLQRDLAAGRKSIDRERKALAGRTTLLEKQRRKAEADLRRREAELEEDARRRAGELAEREKARLEVSAQKERSAHEKERLEWERTRHGLHKRIEDLERRAAAKTPVALQDYSEEALLAELNNAFKGQEDQIERLPRGRKVGDLRHVVMYRGQEVGLIVFEVKNTKTWSNAFVDQAKRYQTVHSTQHVIVVSTTLPPKASAVTIKDGILVVSPEHAVLVVRILRDGLVNMAKAKLSGAEREAKVAQLYVYLTGDDYRQKAEGVVDGVRKLRDLQAAEREAHKRTWDKQEQQHKRIDDDIGEIRSKVDAIIETEVPGVAVRDAKRKKRALAEEIATP